MRPRGSLLVCLALGMPRLAAAQLAANCTVSTPGVAFGAYDPTSRASTTIISSVSLRCTYLLTGFTATISLATGNSGTYGNRLLVSGAQSLSYNVYTDTAHTLVFGNGTNGSYDFTACWAGLLFLCPGGGNVSGGTYTAPVYALLPGGQDVGAGTYADAMVLTVTY